MCQQSRPSNNSLAVVLRCLEEGFLALTPKQVAGLQSYQLKELAEQIRTGNPNPFHIYGKSFIQPTR